MRHPKPTKPPRAIVGDYRKKTAATTEARDEWIRKQAERGVPGSYVAEALGVGQSAISRVYSRIGIVRHRPAVKSNSLWGIGLRTGYIGAAFDQMHPDDRQALIDIATRDKCTIVQALVNHFASTHSEDRA